MKTFSFSLFLLFFLSSSSTLFAQSKNIAEGVKQYEDGRYEDAIAELDIALESAGNLKAKALAKAHYYRAASQITFLRRMVSWENLPEAMAEKVQRYALTAAADLKAVRKNDTDKKYSSEMKNWERKSQKILLGLGKLAMTEGNKPGIEDAARKKRFEAALELGQAGAGLDKFYYAPYNLMGDAALALEDGASALKYYRLADDTFFRSAPKDGDLSIAYTYMHIAELEKSLNKDMAAAEKALTKGQEQLNGEHKKIQVFSNRRPEEKAALDRLYQDINEELARVAARVRGK